MPSSKIEHFNIKLIRNISDGEPLIIGHISYTITKKVKIHISGLYIYYENEKGKGYGYGLMILLLCYVIKTFDNAYYIKKIYLEDCSDCSMTKKSLYYKFGFRITDTSSADVMSIDFLHPELSSHLKSKYHVYEGDDDVSSIYHKTIMDLYDNVLGTDKYKKIINDMNDEIKSNRILVASYKLNDSTNDYEFQSYINVSECLNIDEKKTDYERITRSRNLY